MRICRNSAAWLLLQVSVVCGQLSLLQGQWMELLEYLAQEPDLEAPVRVIAWDFQQPVLRVLRERGMLPTKAQVGVCR